MSYGEAPLVLLGQEGQPLGLAACPCPVQQRGPQCVILRGSVGSTLPCYGSHHLSELQAAAGIECDAIGIQEGRHLVVYLLPVHALEAGVHRGLYEASLRPACWCWPRCTHRCCCCCCCSHVGCCCCCCQLLLLHSEKL